MCTTCTSLLSIVNIYIFIYHNQGKINICQHLKQSIPYYFVQICFYWYTYHRVYTIYTLYINLLVSYLMIFTKKHIIIWGILSIISLALCNIWYTQYAPNYNDFDTTRINGACWTMQWKTVQTFPTDRWEYNAFCAAWEFDERRRTNINQANPLQPQQFVRQCKWLNWWTSTSCQAWWSMFYYTNELASACGTAQWTPYMTTTAIEWIPYTNRNNTFLWNLCITTTNSWQKLPSSPVQFNQTPVWRTRQCPTFLWDPIQCSTPLYQHSYCGISANTWHATIPTTNLCAPWSVAGNISLDTNSLLRRRSCDWNGNGNKSFCQARTTDDTSTMQPSCNPWVIIQPATQTWSETINTFPWQNGCFVWSLSYWVVQNNQAQRRCKTDFNESSFCANVSYPTFSGSAWKACNTRTNGETFTSAHEIFAQWLCQWNLVPNYFQETDDLRVRSCWEDVCQASKSKERLCGRAQNTPWKLYPTDWLCKSWSVPVIQEWESWVNPVRKRSCKEQWTNVIASCEAPRIVNGMCNRETTTNTAWFENVQDIINSWLCTQWVASPMLPVPNTTTWKRTRTCVTTTAWWTNSPVCSAKVSLPTVSVVYNKPKPADGSLLTWPVVAYLTGYNPLYINITTPLNQPSYIFTQNTWFTFYYKDRAWNPWFVRAYVDRINVKAPWWLVQYTPSGPTTWNVVASLTWLTKQIDTISFTWNCVTYWLCSVQQNHLPQNRTVTFSGNSDWYFNIKDTDWIKTTIPVVVTWIDRNAPYANLQYSTTQPTAENVVVSLINESESITIKNNSWLNTYVFTWNWEFAFAFADMAWNTSYLTATVNRIDKKAPTASIFYSTTWITSDPVVATVVFNKTWTKILNNSWSNSYTFTYNHEFTFYLEDPVWNKWSVTAKVDWIQWDILPVLIKQYTDNVCSKFKKRLPVDIQWNEFNYHITTVIMNCLMKWYTLENNHTYFYPRKHIKRWEFLTIVWRYIRLVTNYEWDAVNALSQNFIGVSDNSIFGPEISEADARGLLFYTPLIKVWTQKMINVDGNVSAREAKYILKQALRITGMNPQILDSIMVEADDVTRWDMAFLMTTLLQNQEWVALGNNVSFLRALASRTEGMSPQELKKFVIQIYLKIKQVPDSMIMRVGLEPNQLKADLLWIAEWRLPKKRKKPFFFVKTVMDDFLRNYDDVFNNEVFNDSDIYTDMMFEKDTQWDNGTNVFGE